MFSNPFRTKKKPKLFFGKGYWRVSPKPKPYHRHNELWNAAHDHVNKLNAAISLAKAKQKQTERDRSKSQSCNNPIDSLAEFGRIASENPSKRLV